MGASPPAPKKTENISKSTADRCFAVLPEQIFAQARQSSRRILVVLSRALTQRGRKSARQNRYVFDSRQLKEQGLKDKLPGMTEDEMYALLATDGMLVKRPMLIADDFVLVGFKEPEWEKAVKHQ